MSPWLFYVYMDGVMEKMGMGRREVSFMEDGGCLADDLVLCSE